MYAPSWIWPSLSSFDCKHEFEVKRYRKLSSLNVEIANACMVGQAAWRPQLGCVLLSDVEKLALH